MSTIRRMIVTILGICIVLQLGRSCSSPLKTVRPPNYTLLKESSKYYGGMLEDPNGKDGMYIILNNNLQTFMRHARYEDVIGTWRMQGDTLILDLQLYARLSREDPGVFLQIPESWNNPKRYLMTKKYAYDITDLWQNVEDQIIYFHSPDSPLKEKYLNRDPSKIKIKINQKLIEELMGDGLVIERFEILKRSEP